MVCDRQKTTRATDITETMQRDSILAESFFDQTRSFHRFYLPPYVSRSAVSINTHVIFVFQVLGFCLPRGADDTRSVAMVTELGESVDLIKLLQMSWEDRLRVSVCVGA